MGSATLRCTGCKERFKRETMIRLNVGNFHSLDCSISYAIKKSGKSKEKARRVKLAKDKEKIKRKADYIKDAQRWFNKYIRLRDIKEPCICCGREPTNEIQWHAGHYLTTGARPEHRFNELNCHKQTSYCNNYLSGNVAEYRKKLIVKYGEKSVLEMEQDHSPKRYTKEDLKEIIKRYKSKCKEIENTLA